MNSLDVSINSSGDVPAPSDLLRHVAIIMDGNGRWAEREGVRRSNGHKKGSEAVKEAVEGAIRSGVEYLTLYAFSTENWNRSKGEVSDLMGLLRLYLSKEINQLHKENVKLIVIGNRDDLDDDIQRMIGKAEEKTKDNDRLTLIIALSYGSRQEIVLAAKRIASLVKEGEVSESDISEDMLSAHMYTADIPDPDLLIRTSGEHRLSNFLLWQLAYAEFVFLDILWPDFKVATFEDAIKQYAMRERRYGGRIEEPV